jgi:hypothetical protein
MTNNMHRLRGTGKHPSFHCLLASTYTGSAGGDEWRPSFPSVMASRYASPAPSRRAEPREGTRAFSGPLIATAVRSSSSVEGRSCQFGRANAPMMPQLVHTIRGPNHGTGTSSGLGVDTEHRLMVAEVADDPQRAHALRPHVGERHWRAAVAIHGHAVNLPLDKTREQAR